MTIDDGLDCSGIRVLKLFGIHSLNVMRSTWRADCSEGHHVHLVDIRIPLIVAISPQEALGTSILGSDQNLLEHFHGPHKLRRLLLGKEKVPVLCLRLSLAMFLQLWLQRRRPIESCLAYSGCRSEMKQVT